jgi:RNA polymerase sigma-70 factor (ECF subfamily)
MDPNTVAWVTSNFLPFEADLRAILRLVCSGSVEMDDVIQEVYCKVLMLGSVAHIREPKAFLVRMAKNVATDRFRREAIVSIEAMECLDELEVQDSSSPERIAMARSELKWVNGLIAKLPKRCQDVFRARRIYAMSQLEAAEMLGISEGIVEQEMMKGVSLISDMIAREGVHEDLRNRRS